METDRSIAEITDIDLEIKPDNLNKRLDVYLTKHTVFKYSRTYFQKLIREGLVKVNGRTVRSNYILRLKDRVVLQLPRFEPEETENLPENIPLEIVYEDDYLLVVNKKAGMVVHPAVGNRCGTLVNALLYRCENLSGMGEKERPGIVHRLDKETSGLLIVAKDNITHKALSAQFASRSVKKIYTAIVAGKMSKSVTSVSLAIGRDINDRKKISHRTVRPKDAVTNITVLKRTEHCTLLELQPETGRTHQLRVHLQYLGHPIIGDKTYGKSFCNMAGIAIARQMLHAKRLFFTHPNTGMNMEVEAPMPEDMSEILDLLSIE